MSSANPIEGFFLELDDLWGGADPRIALRVIGSTALTLQAERRARAAWPMVAEAMARQSRTETGRVFTPFDVLDLGSPFTVGMTLSCT